ncbi:MAG: heterocyst differentiation protein HetZ [Thainema sp.]
MQTLLNELQQATGASEQSCQAVAQRLYAEVQRVCTESHRIQTSGDIESWARSLIRHRRDQCLKYYKLGSRQGRVELHSTLSAIVYRYMSPPQVRSSYQARLTIIEDFLQGFYLETLNAFRRENQMPDDYCPRTLLELSEYMAFSERYGKRRIPLPGRRSQQIIILRAKTFSKQQPPELSIDLEQATEAGTDDDQPRSAASAQRVREQIVAQAPEPAGNALRDRVIQELVDYLRERNQEDCAAYFELRLQDQSAQEIEQALNLNPRQRDYLQQRFKYHLTRFALSHHWELVHQWLEADLERNLGLTPEEWRQFQAELQEPQQQLLALKLSGLEDAEILRELGCTATQLQRQWSKLLEQAWDIRNCSMSGAGILGDE